MIKVGVFGATGFTGEKLIDLLLGHPGVKITYLAAIIEKKSLIANYFLNLKLK